MGEVKWVVKRPDPAAYYSFDDPEWGLIELFDGTRTRTEIFEQYRAMFPKAGIEYSLILDYEEVLKKMSLLEQSVAERNLALLAKFKNARQRAAEEKAEGFNPFFILFHVLDPNRFLDRTVKYVRWIWTPPVVLISSVFFLWTIAVFTTHWEPIWAGTVELYAFLKKPLLDVIQFFCILSVIGFFHEFSHAYATKIYGGEVHDIGVALLYFTPAFYCDTTDSLLFQNKWHSLWVTTAGIYVEAFLCSAATALWIASYPDTLLHELAYKTMLFTGASTVFFNINPLIKIDGYYALTSLLEIPELREESLRYLGAWLQRHVFRLNVDVPEASRRKRRIYWLYGTLALAWLGVVMSFIAGLFYNFYTKFFPNLAILLLFVTLYQLFRKRVRLLTRTIKLLYLDKKDLLMSPRSRRTLLALAGALPLLLFVPWTHRKIGAPLLLRPLTEVRLEAPEDSVVAEVLVREGDSVRPGQPVLRLESLKLNASALELAAVRRRFEKATRGAREAGQPSVVFRSERREDSVDAAIRRESVRRGRLVVASPIAGRILTPRLEDLEGRYVRAGTELAQVGNCRMMRAELPVSERLFDDLQPNAPVAAMLPGRPLSTVRGRVASISPATLDHPRTATFEGHPAAPTAYPERFVALAVFDNPDGSLLPGMIGKAKIVARRASLVSRTWRVLWRWFRTTAW
jgi:putative peptide zinc metalloprotease protein